MKNQVIGLVTPGAPPVRLTFISREAGDVKAEVFNVAGRRLRVFELGRVAAGTHPLEWDGTDFRGHRVPSGVYWMRAWLNELALPPV